jgi:general secretion pathway protein N
MTVSRRPLIAALAVFLAAWLIRSPLSLITLVLPPQVQLKNVQGSIWNGSASAIGVGGMIVQERVEWSFRPQALLSARIEWLVSGRFGAGASTLTLGLDRGGPRLGQASVYLPLEPFAALHPKLKSLRIGATLHASAASSQPPTRATLQIDGLFSPLVPQSSALGSYLLELDMAQDGAGSWGLRSLPGVLAATGQGKFDVRRSQFTGQLLLNPGSPLPGLSPALSQLPHSDAGYLISF